MTEIMEYLRRKFPCVDEAEITSEVIRTVQEMRKVDEICRTCEGQSCELKGRAVPFLKLSEDRWGRKHIEVRMSFEKKCRYRILDEDLFMRSGLKDWQKEQTFENFKGDDVYAAQKALRNHTNLILSGQTGRGKTHLAAAMMIEIMREGRQAMFYPVGDMLDELLQGGEGYFVLMKKLKTVPFLVLDDLGLERNTGLEYLYRIIDARYRDRLQTVVTTNALQPEELSANSNARIIAAILSRLLENGSWVTLCGEVDWRLS